MFSGDEIYVFGLIQICVFDSKMTGEICAIYVCHHKLSQPLEE
jgi:hypothetical protein